jgi:hypothetical protein
MKIIKGVLEEELKKALLAEKEREKDPGRAAPRRSGEEVRQGTPVLLSPVP